ncbi:hypothetical protein G6F22_018984 [Rhizopus arrhizus]|nr:hypothetical protein G6F22_018984 [Rhizopus arrhizus]
MPLVLASTSRYRRELLQRLGLPFACARPDVDETPLNGEAPLALATRLAAAKAAEVAARNPGAWVIGSDQVADLNGQPLGKPGTVEAACAQLAAMSGRTVRFHTAICLSRAGESFTAIDLTEPNSRWTAPAASNAKAWASACSRRSTTATRPRWSACR